MSEILTPLCPQCDSAPYMVFGGDPPQQAFCGNDDCSTLCWNPSKSVDENLMDTNFVELRQREDSSEEGEDRG